MVADYGQWMPGISPTNDEGFLMALSDQQQSDVYNNVQATRGEVENTVITALGPLGDNVTSIRGETENTVIPLLSQIIDQCRSSDAKLDDLTARIDALEGKTS